MIWLHIIGGLPLAYAIISAAEWYVHKYHMHRKGWMNWVQDVYQRHTLVHHRAYGKDFIRCKCEEDRTVGVDLDLASTLKLSLPVSLIMGVFLPVEAIMLLSLSLFHAMTWTSFHREMHMPRGSWFTKTPWYRICLKHHELHHQQPSRNLNIICLGMDHIMGTVAR